MDWKTPAKNVLKVAGSAPILTLIVLAVALYFGTLAIESLFGGPEAVPVYHPRVVQRAEEDPDTKRWLEVTVPCPSAGLPVQRPPKATRKALAEDFHLPDLLVPNPSPSGTGVLSPNKDTLVFNREVVGKFLVPKMPEGGKALLTYSTVDESFALDFEVDPWTETPPEPKRRWIAFPKQWGFGAFGQTDSSGGVDWTKFSGWDAYAFVEPLRTGKITWRVQAGRQHVFGTEGNYVKFGGEYRRR